MIDDRKNLGFDVTLAYKALHAVLEHIYRGFKRIVVGIRLINFYHTIFAATNYKISHTKKKSISCGSSGSNESTYKQLSQSKATQANKDEGGRWPGD